jgi:hypothetical protein
MAIRSTDDESAAGNAWREVASHQGEAFEAYGRALKGFGDGSLPAEALVREVVGLTARGTADAVRISLGLAEDLYRWAWSLADVRIAPRRWEGPEPAARDSWAQNLWAQNQWTESSPPGDTSGEG